MSSKRYTEEFKIQAVKQVTERGYGIYSVASRLGVTFMPGFDAMAINPVQHAAITDQQAEINRLRAELQRVTDERDILKKATAYFAKESL